MIEKRKGKPLSSEETAKILGAEVSEDLGPVSLDPIGLRALATKIAQRMLSQRGRPTDVSWDTVRKVPMSITTWIRLKEISAALLANQNVRVAPGQLAAMALERGVPTLSAQDVLRETSDQVCGAACGWEFNPECEEEAGELCAVIQEEGCWV